MSDLSPQFAAALDIVKDNPIFAGAVREFYASQLSGKSESREEKTRWTANELLQTNFPETKPVIRDRIFVGLNNLGGRPKLGKSWLALGASAAVGTGGYFLGVKAEIGDVLYLALEDGARRLKERLTAQRIPSSARITFVTSWEPLSKGGLHDLETELLVKDYRLVVIDTFSRASGGVDDQQDLQAMTRVMGDLQHLALSRNLAILLIDHHKKPAGFNSDPIDDILGSTGKSAVADCVMGLYRERGKPGANLRITGRDIADVDLALTWDSDLCCWQYAGPADQVREDSEKGKVLAAVKTLHDNGELPTTKNISEFTGVAKPNVNTCLQELATEGKIERGAKIGVQQPYYPAGYRESHSDQDLDL